MSTPHHTTPCMRICASSDATRAHNQNKIEGREQPVPEGVVAFDLRLSAMLVLVCGMESLIHPLSNRMATIESKSKSIGGEPRPHDPAGVVVRKKFANSHTYRQKVLYDLPSPSLRSLNRWGLCTLNFILTVIITARTPYWAWTYGPRFSIWVAQRMATASSRRGETYLTSPSC